MYPRFPGDQVLNRKQPERNVQPGLPHRAGKDELWQHLPAQTPKLRPCPTASSQRLIYNQATSEIKVRHVRVFPSC
jgi:hypothetical protein